MIVASARACIDGAVLRLEKTTSESTTTHTHTPVPQQSNEKGGCHSIPGPRLVGWAPSSKGEFGRGEIELHQEESSGVFRVLLWWGIPHTVLLGQSQILNYSKIRASTRSGVPPAGVTRRHAGQIVPGYSGK